MSSDGLPRHVEAVKKRANMTRALQSGLFDELVIDNFAGGDGAS